MLKPFWGYGLLDEGLIVNRHRIMTATIFY